MTDDSYEVKDFNTDVLVRSSSIPVVVDFWAGWCGPCKVLGPILEKLAENNGGRWVLAKVDVDRNQDIAARFGISGIPAVKIFVDGAMAGEFTGALPEPMVTQWLTRFLPARFAKEIATAERLLASGDYDGAVPILDNVLADDPENEHARTVRATTLLFSDTARAVSLVQGIEEDSAHFSSADMTRTIAELKKKKEHPELLQEDPAKASYLAAIASLLSRQYDDALDRFIGVIRMNRSYDDDGSRKAVIAIFRLLGDDHEVTRGHRREFGSALNA